MSVTVEIPTPLRRFTVGHRRGAGRGRHRRRALADLVRRHPQLQRHLFDDAGKVRSFVNVFVNDDNVRYADGGATKLDDGDTVSIIPSIAGGTAVWRTRRRPRMPLPRREAPPRRRPLPELTAGELRRYSRHLIMPEVGTEGQRRLKASKVLMIGTGGLGSPLGLYLAAAGVGRLGLVDFDVVDERTCTARCFAPPTSAGRRLEAAAERLRGINPHDRRRAARGPPRLVERPRPLRGLRPGGRRHRQLPHPLPGQRRLRAHRQAERLRLDLPLRGAGVGVLGRPGAVLPLPLPGAAAAGAGAVVRRGRGARACCRGSSARCRPTR